MGGPPALVIEFLGLPGAGKSTLAEHLLCTLRAEGRALGSREAIGRFKGGRAEHYARLVAFTVAQRRHLSTAMRLAAAVAPASMLRWRFAAKLATWPYRLSLAHRCHHDTLVLDQGPLQSAWCVLLDGELREEGALRAAVHDLLTGGRFAFAFVYVDVAPELAADRIAARGPMGPPFHRDRAETLRLLTAHRQHLARILQIAEEHVGAPALRVDGSAPLEQNDGRIAAFVGRLPRRAWRPRASPPPGGLLRRLAPR
jgi:thymidylate kinase